MNEQHPIDLWREKLAFFQQQEAIEADAAKKFQLQKQIDEAKGRIAQLQTQPQYLNSQLKSHKSDDISPETTMWEALVINLVDMSDRAAKPRREFVNAVMRLYHCMNQCHEAYLKSKTHDIYEDQRWRDAIVDLILALWENRDVLEVFAPPVALALKGYVAGEVESFYRPSAVRLQELGPEARDKYELLLSSVWNECYQTEQFETALASLRGFVMENLKPEDLYL